MWLRATLRYGATEEKAFAGEVGLRGAFIVTMTPRPVRQLLGLSLALPEGEPLEVNGMVARSVRPEEAARLGVPPGMGIQFYGLSRAGRERWEQVFFRLLTGRIRRTSAPPTSRAARSGGAPSLVIVDGAEPAAGAVGPKRARPSQRPAEPYVALTRVRRRPGDQGARTAPTRAEEPASLAEATEGAGQLSSWYQYFLDDDGTAAASRSMHAEGRHEEPPGRAASAPDCLDGPVLYRLAVGGARALRQFGATVLSARGIFLRSVDPRPPGTPVVVCVVHPLSGEELHLPGEVVSVADDRPGVAVALHGLRKRDVRDFERFAAEGRVGSSAGETADVPTLSHAPPRLCGAEGQRPEAAQDVGLSGLMVLTATGRASPVGSPGGSADEGEELSVSDLEIVDD